MRLLPGACLGPYEIVSALGAGGMGEVYRARDTRLGRDVALKILPAAIAENRERRARFEQEARHVAALNHPNILALFDVGADADMAFMTTELVDGEPLRTAVLTPRKTFDVAAQIADGLAAAHAAGVVHRDLKPDNVMLTRDGRVKLLDFGIAKAIHLGNAADPTVAHTEAGLVVGTARYMSPEQVRGGTVDQRTDIFAFGALLYELVSGRPAFTGDSAAEIMTAILKHEPADMPATVPPMIRQIVRRCLEKQPDERFQSARDLAFALRQSTTDSSAATVAIAGTPRPRRRFWSLGAAGVGLGVIGGAIAGVLLVRSSANRDDPSIEPIRLRRFSSDVMTENGVAFSPDGRSIAYRRIGISDSSILVHALDAASPVLLVKSGPALATPVWTADGTRVCYSSVQRVLSCVSATGGTPQTVLRDVSVPQFTPDGKSVLFIRAADGGPAIFESTPPGAEPIRRTDLPLPRDFVTFELSRDGTKILVQSETALSVLSMATKATVPVTQPPDAQPRAVAWLPDNRHIAVVELTSDPVGFRVVVADTESTARRLVYRAAEFLTTISVSPDGRQIVYSAGRPEYDVHEYAMSGTYSRRGAASSNMDRFPAWSPRGDAWLYVVGGPGRPDEFWTARTAGGEPSRLLTLTTRGPLWSNPVFSPDGNRVAWADETAIRTLAAAGGRPITVQSANTVPGLCWSPDGEWIWYSDGPPPTLRKVPSQGGQPVAVRESVSTVFDCSPDGRWVSARGRTGFVIVSTDGKEERGIASVGDEYAFAADNTMQFGEGGRVLYLLRRDRRSITTVDVASGTTRRTIAFPVAPDDVIQGFSVHPDGTRVLLTTGMHRDDLWIAEGFAQPATGWRRWIRHWQQAILSSPGE